MQALHVAKRGFLPGSQQNGCAMSDRLKKISHRGCTILFTDYSNFSTFDEWKVLLDAERAMMPGERPGSVLALAVFTGSRLSASVFSAIKELSVINKPYVKASALVGLSSLQQAVFLKGIERTSDRSFGLFDSVEEAKDWLADRR
jgi:hypothetical protein